MIDAQYKDLQEERDTLAFLIKDLANNAGDYPMRDTTTEAILSFYLAQLEKVDTEIQNHPEYIAFFKELED